VAAASLRRVNFSFLHMLYIFCASSDYAAYSSSTATLVHHSQLRNRRSTISDYAGSSQNNFVGAPLIAKIMRRILWKLLPD
jgi:hypothetical protein